MKRINKMLEKKLINFLILCVVTGGIVVGHTYFKSDRTDEVMRYDGMSQEKERIFLPVIMYHSVVKEGNLGEYVVSADILEKDIKWLKEHNYEPVFVEDVITYVKGDGVLPPKPVMITFDDGMKNNMDTAFEVMKKYDAKGVYSVVGSYCDGGDPYMSWDELKEFSQEALVEIQHHSYSFHELGQRKGSMRMAGEGFCEYVTEFASDTSKMNNALAENADIKTSCYTYPFGLISTETYPVLESLGFEASFSCIEKGNYITKEDESCLHLMKRYNRAAGETTENFMNRITSE